MEERPRHYPEDADEDDGGQPPGPPTVEQLLPALVELASIQADMMASMEMWVTEVSKSIPVPRRIERFGALRARSRSVLYWLLSRSKSGF